MSAPIHVQFMGETCDVVFARYGNGRIAIQLITANGEPWARATVNLPAEPLGADEVFIKDYSENEGMLDVLVAAGVVEDTGVRVDSGWVTVPVARLLVKP